MNNAMLFDFVPLPSDVLLTGFYKILYSYILILLLDFLRVVIAVVVIEVDQSLRSWGLEGNVVYSC